MNDKLLHFAAGLVIAAPDRVTIIVGVEGLAALTLMGLNPKVEEATKSKELGCLSAIVAGAAKEMIDFVPDPFDFFATVADGCADHTKVFGPHKKE